MILDTGYRIQDARYRMNDTYDTGYTIHDSGYRIEYRHWK